MSKRIQHRRANGQYQRATLANTFGLGNEICRSCGQCHPYRLGVEELPRYCVGCNDILPTYMAQLERMEEEQEFTRAVRDFRDMWNGGGATE